MENTKKNTGASGVLKSILTSTAGMVFIVTVVITLIVHLITRNFYTAYNIGTFMRSSSFTILIGFAQTLVLLLGGIDLSAQKRLTFPPSPYIMEHVWWISDMEMYPSG